jgi:hypothetical protein
VIGALVGLGILDGCSFSGICGGLTFRKLTAQTNVLTALTVFGTEIYNNLTIIRIHSIFDIGENMHDEIQVCTRLKPHICQVNGPCNGWPKVGSSDGDYQGLCSRCKKPIYELSGDPYAHVGCLEAK